MITNGVWMGSGGKEDTGRQAGKQASEVGK